MSEQLSWLKDLQLQDLHYNRVIAVADTPRARRSDPETSHEAAEAILDSGELGRQQRAVLAAVRRWPGLTSLELGARMEINRWAVARRLPELEPVHVRKGEPRAKRFERARSLLASL